MRQFFTTVLERKTTHSAPFQTEPYEAAWASEAIFFIRVENVDGTEPQLSAKVQISPDGIHWADEGANFLPISDIGLHFVKVTHFGGWLRLGCDVQGQDAHFKLIAHLVLKE